MDVVLFLMGLRLIDVLDSSVRRVRLRIFLLRGGVLVLQVSVRRLLSRFSRANRERQNIVSRNATLTDYDRLSSSSYVVNVVISVIVVRRFLRAVSKRVRIDLCRTSISSYLSHLTINAIARGRASNARSSALSYSYLAHSSKRTEVRESIRLISRHRILSVWLLRRVCSAF